MTLVAAESLAVATIMPIVGRDLGDRDLYGWVFAGFFLGSLLGVVVAGSLIDRGSLVRPFVLGLGLFAIGLLVGGLAPSMPVLVGSRLLQGLGAGAIPAIAYVAIGRALPEALRPRMFATLSTAWVVPSIVGPALAGAVAESLHWRLVFLGLLPLIGLAAAMTLPVLAGVAPAPAATLAAEHLASADTRRRLPWALLLAIGAGLVLAGLTDARPVPGLPLLAGGALATVAAYRRLTPAGTLAVARGLPAAVLLRGLLTFGFFAADAYVPLALQDWRGTSATVAGLALTTTSLAWTSGSWIQARRVARHGPARFVRIGFVLILAGIAGFATILSPAVPIVVGIAAWALAGLGMGLAYSSLSLIVLRDARPGTEGAATSGLQLSDGLGTSLGTGVGGALIAIAARSGGPGWLGLGLAFAAGGLVAATGVGLAGRLRSDGGGPTAAGSPRTVLGAGPTTSG